MRHFLIVLLFIAAGSLSAQDFVAESSLTECTEDGYYKFEVKPALSAWLTSDFSNLRVLNQAGLQIPYVVETGHDYLTREYVEYKITEKRILERCCTNVVFESAEGSAINNIYLRIRNADVSKTGTLSGSDDGKNWFALRDKFYFAGINGGDNVSELRLLDFPLSNYKFYQLSINDSTSAPLNILSVGYYKVIEQKASYSTVLPEEVNVADSIKRQQTFIDLRFESQRWIDRIVIKAEGPPLFMRKGTLYAIAERKNKKGKMEQVVDRLADFSVSNDQPAMIDLSEVKGSKFRIVVENNDSPPLKKYEVTSFQQRRYGIAWLEKGITYKLFVGKESMRSPEYDLQLFKHRLPVNMLSLDHGEPIVISETAIDKKTDNGLQSKYLVWAGLIGIILVLGVLSFRMIRETKTSE
jgi:hypothetical protein